MWVRISVWQSRRACYWNYSLCFSLSHANSESSVPCCCPVTVAVLFNVTMCPLWLCVTHCRTQCLPGKDATAWEGWMTPEQKSLERTVSVNRRSLFQALFCVLCLNSCWWSAVPLFCYKWECELHQISCLISGRNQWRWNQNLHLLLKAFGGLG